MSLPESWVEVPIEIIADVSGEAHLIVQILPILAARYLGQHRPM